MEVFSCGPLIHFICILFASIITIHFLKNKMEYFSTNKEKEKVEICYKSKHSISFWVKTVDTQLWSDFAAENKTNKQDINQRTDIQLGETFF